MVKKLNKEEYNELVINGKGKVLVDFYADWCGPCKMLGPIMEEISEENTVYKVNVDEEDDLASSLGIMSIPCVIMFNDGVEGSRLIGLHSKDEVLGLLK